MAGPWVIYEAVAKPGVRAVCTQAEWARKVAANPGRYALVRDNIATESEADRLARGKAGDVSHRSKWFNRPDDDPPA